MSLPEYSAARTVMFYVDVRSEVRTRHSLPDALARGKRIVRPQNNQMLPRHNAGVIAHSTSPIAILSYTAGRRTEPLGAIPPD